MAVDLQAESRCMEKLQLAHNSYAQLLEVFSGVVGNEEAQNVNAMVNNQTPSATAHL